MQKRSLEAHLDAEGIHLTMARGLSMTPYLRDGDLVTIKSLPPLQSLKRGAIVLYRRQDKVLVLHRIMSLEDGKIVLNGDGCTYFEYPQPTQLLGILVGRQRKGKDYPIQTWQHQMYQMIWIRPWRIRFFVLKAVRKIRKKWCRDRI